MTALIGDVIIPLSHGFDLGPFILGCALASILAFMLAAFIRSGLFGRTYPWQTASAQGLGEVSPLGDDHNRLSRVVAYRRASASSHSSPTAAFDRHGRLSWDKLSSAPMRCDGRR
jgi:hypothetical protein